MVSGAAHSGDEDLQSRLDRLESIDEIRQLVSKYAISLDMRDLDAPDPSIRVR